MKKQILSALVTALSIGTLNAQYGFAPPVGVATSNPFAAPPLLNMTAVPASNTAYVSGAIWNYNTVDFNRSFVLDFDAMMDVLYGTGADGFCVVFKQNASLTSLGGSGGEIGYYSGPDFMSNSFAVEFDNFNNSGGYGDPLPYNDHIMIARDGSPAGANILWPPTPILPTGATVKDGIYRRYRIIWECQSNTLRVFVNGNERVNAVGFDYRTLFTNPSSVTWGFTGAVAASGSNHFIRNVSMRTGEVCPQECHYQVELITQKLANGQMQFQIFPNSSNAIIAGYMWDFGDGTSPVITTGPVVQHSYAVSGSYLVRVRILGYNVTTGECCPFDYQIPVQVVGGGGGQGDVGRQARPGAAAGSDFKVYPNPSSGRVSITSSGFKFTSVQVFDINGRKVIDLSIKPTDNRELDLQRFGKGLYLLQLNDEQGNKHVQKITLQD